MTRPTCCICGAPITYSKTGYKLLNKTGLVEHTLIKDYPRNPNADIIVDSICLFGLPEGIRGRLWLRITNGKENEKEL